MEADHVTNQRELMANTAEDRDAKIQFNTQALAGQIGLRDRDLDLDLDRAQVPAKMAGKPHIKQGPGAMMKTMPSSFDANTESPQFLVYFFMDGFRYNQSSLLNLR